MVDFSSLLPDSAEVSTSGVTIGQCLLRDLAERYGTPLYIYDEVTLRTSSRAARRAFDRISARVSFAAKSCSTLSILRILRDEHLDLDAVSGGELMAARMAGFTPEQIHLHGNYKSEAELKEAVQLGLHAVVVDNLYELERLETLCRSLSRTTRVMLRITLPGEADTHPHIQTSGLHSKFGFQRASPVESSALAMVQNSRFLQFCGLHTHVGSQIRDVDIYRQAARELIALARRLVPHGLVSEEISIGGGWGVPYRRGDSGLSPEVISSALRPYFADCPEFRPAVEPGRALVARAGVALYRIGSVKWIANERIVAVDGGMGDNPRPALYDAKYDAIAVRNPRDEPLSCADIVGRYCESGDVLATSVPLPEVVPEELICIPVSGAYQLSMESTYNRVPLPAVVLVRDGRSQLIVRRGTAHELFARESIVDPTDA